MYKRHVGVAIQSGIVECAECGHAVLASRYLSIQHVEESREKNNQRAGKKMADGEGRRSNKVNHQAQKCQEVRIDASGGQRANNFVEQPLASLTDSASERSHACVIYLKKIRRLSPDSRTSRAISPFRIREIVHYPRCTPQTSHFGAPIMRVLNIFDSPFSLDANRVAAYIPNSLASLHL